ncbi:hypothetical protein ACWODB_03160 [Facklamia hominis]
MDGLDSDIVTDEFMIATIVFIAQAEKNLEVKIIKLGHQKRALEWTSKLYDHMCYG